MKATPPKQQDASVGEVRITILATKHDAEKRKILGEPRVLHLTQHTTERLIMNDLTHDDYDRMARGETLVVTDPLDPRSVRFVSMIRPNMQHVSGPDQEKALHSAGWLKTPRGSWAAPESALTVFRSQPSLLQHSQRTYGDRRDDE